MSTLASSAPRTSPAFVDRGLAVGAPVGDHRLDLGVLARVQDLERAVLELPLDRVDAEPVRERRVDLERLLRLAHLRLLALVLDRAHVVEPVGELDQDDAHVLRHRDDHLAVVLGLRLLAGLEARPGQLRDALDELRDLVAELGADLLEVGARCPRRRRAAARRRATARRGGARRRSSRPPTDGGRTARRSCASGPRARSRRSGTRARAAPCRRPGCTPRRPRSARRRGPGDADRRQRQP